MRNITRILYVVDQKLDSQGMEKAIDIAASHQAELTFIDVLPELKLSPQYAAGIASKVGLEKTIEEARRQAIENTLKSRGAATAARIIMASGRRYMEVIHAVLRDRYDLVIKLAEAPSWVGRFVSSDDMHLMRKCPSPVWLLQESTHSVGKNVVVAAVDFDPDIDLVEQQALNKKILAFASSVALFESAELHVLHVWDSPIAGFASLWSEVPEQTEQQILSGEYNVRRDMMSLCERALKEMLGDASFGYLKPLTRLVQGNPEEHIPGYADEVGADVVVMGTVGRTGIPGLFIGNTAENVLQQLRCSVVAIKPDGFQSPVV